MRYLSMFLMMLLLIAGCIAPPGPYPPGPSGPGQTQIEAVTFTETSGTVAPMFWRKKQLTVRSDLSTHYVVSNYQGRVLERKRGYISQTQFNTLVKALRTARYRQLTSLNKPAPFPVGGGASTLTVQTRNGVFTFQDNASKAFPPGIVRVFNMWDQLKP